MSLTKTPSGEYVEVRVPTYRRPALLRRALTSLIQQDHEHWYCIVMDDGNQQETERVCKELHDSRIAYRPNKENLGICKNLNRACSIEPLEKASYICVLEDDNYFLPNHFSDSIAKLKSSNCDILLRNQRIEIASDREELGTPSDQTMYDGQYKEGKISNLKLFAAFFYSIGATNAGLFWKANSGIDFSTTEYVDDVVWQERLRTLCIDRPVYIAMQPTVVWRNNAGGTWRTAPKGLRWYLYSAGLAAIERTVYRCLFNYLKRMHSSRYVWMPPEGTFDSNRARVFHRVGIRIPWGVKKLGYGARLRLCTLRNISRVLSVFSSRQIYCQFANNRLAIAKEGRVRN